MLILTTQNLSDYELLDSGDGKRLERFGKYILSRPDPQCIWQISLPKSDWDKADAVFNSNSATDRGHWKKIHSTMPERWTIKFDQLTVECKLSPFKHTGVFPEQNVHWEWIMEKVKSYTVTKPVSNNGDVRRITPDDTGFVTDQRTTIPNVLNLFGYTGLATLAAAAAGAKVTHVDASYPTIGWGRENQKLSNLEQKPIRWILDHCIKFCEREVKRGVKYDGIIMDPPIYGHGPKGEKWDFNKSFPQLLELCVKLLSDKPLFLIVNAYAISASSIMLENVLNDFMRKFEGKVESGELVLQETGPLKRNLSTGIFVRWSK